MLITAPVAAAHTELVSTMPADGAVLDTAPTEIVFTFSEDLLPGATSLSVFDDAGVVLARATVDPQGASVRMALPSDLPSGVLHAAYRVVSGDGHPVTGEISFTVRGGTPVSTAETGAPRHTTTSSPPTGAPESATTDPQQSREERQASANFSIVLGVILVALAVALYVKRRRQQQEN